MGVRKQLETMEEIHGIRFSFNVLDFQRYLDIQNSRIGTDSVEIDFEEIHGSLLPCLPAHSGSDEYASYLVVLPGKLLADIYGKYGARLLEQNVRTFLQARTKVNKGIIQTTIKPQNIATFYTRHGDIFAKLNVLILILFIFGRMIRKK